MKRKTLVMVVSIFLAVMLVLPSSAWAAESRPPTMAPGGTCVRCQVGDVTFETITPTAKIAYLTDADGARQAVALRFRQVGNEQRVYFSFLENETDIELFREFSRNEEMRKQSQGRAPGLASMRRSTIGIGWGSWMSWNGNQLRVYISRELAAQLRLNLNVCTWVYTIAAIAAAAFGNIPATTLTALTAIACQLTADAIAYWDDRGAPGFYICATKSPLRAWIEP